MIIYNIYIYIDQHFLIQFSPSHSFHDLHSLPGDGLCHLAAAESRHRDEWDQCARPRAAAGLHYGEQATATATVMPGNAR